MLPDNHLGTGGLVSGRVGVSSKMFHRDGPDLKVPKMKKTFRIVATQLEFQFVISCIDIFNGVL